LTRRQRAVFGSRVMRGVEKSNVFSFKFFLGKSAFHWQLKKISLTVKRKKFSRAQISFRLDKKFGRQTLFAEFSCLETPGTIHFRGVPKSHVRGKPVIS
jgi:hypothetical protein